MSGETPLVSLNEVKYTEDETVLFLKNTTVFLLALLTWGSSRNKEFTVIYFSLQCPQDDTWRSYIFKAPPGTDNLFVFLSRDFWCCVRILQKVLYSLSTTGVEREDHRQLLGDMKFLPCLSFSARSMSFSLACSGNPCDVHVVKGLPL